MTDLDAEIRAALDDFCTADWCAEKGKAAILAVLELHQPESVDYIDADRQERTSSDCETCGAIGGVVDTWPCPTVQAIAEGLGIEA